MTPFLRSRAAWYVLAAVFIVASLLVLGVRTLIPPDEGRYAEMAREMLLSGDWITTRLNGIKYFEKPPLHTWMSALSFGKSSRRVSSIAAMSPSSPDRAAQRNGPTPRQNSGRI